MKLKLKPKSTSELGYAFIEILTANFNVVRGPDSISRFHLCNTDKGVVLLSAEQIQKDLKSYHKVPNKNDLAQVIQNHLELWSD